MTYCVIHYSGEIGSKGMNRKFFEKQLRENIRCSLKKPYYETIRFSNSRIIVHLSDKADRTVVASTLKKIAGIAFFSFAYCCKQSISEIKKTLSLHYSYYKDHRVWIAVANKAIGITREEIEKALGLTNESELQFALFVEVLDAGCFVYNEKIKGLGGLPVGSTGKLVSLISGGIDSPVAAFKMFRRGCSIAFVHFSNPTQGKEMVKDKIVRLVDLLTKYQFKTKLYIIKFDEIQRAIITFVPADMRMIIYRRIMFTIAGKIAEIEHAKGFVTGDSLSQVASQTLENIGVTYKAASYPVFHPLIGEDKETIIKLAKEIGTYEISILPYADCCSFFVAEHPQTKTDMEYIEKVENRLKTNNLDTLIDAAVRNAEVKVFMN